MVKEYISNCCGAEVYEETDICSKCGEHCELELVDDSEETLNSMDRF